MKKKILVGMGAFILVAVLLLNVTLIKSDQNLGISLKSLITIAKADGEDPNNTCYWNLIYTAPNFEYIILRCMDWGSYQPEEVQCTCGEPDWKIYL